MQKLDIFGKVLTLKLKDNTFQSVTRSITLPRFANSLDELHRSAQNLLETEIKNLKQQSKLIPYRLMGIRMASIIRNPKTQSTKSIACGKITNFLTKGSLQKEQRKEITSATSQVDSRKKKWKCLVCTFMNRPGMDACKMCETLKDTNSRLKNEPNSHLNRSPSMRRNRNTIQALFSKTALLKKPFSTLTILF